jgi:hypothetical protein
LCCKVFKKNDNGSTQPLPSLLRLLALQKKGKEGDGSNGIAPQEEEEDNGNVAAH